MASPNSVEAGIAVAHRQIPQDLVVGAVFLDDINNVLDMSGGERHLVRVFVAEFALEVIVVGHLLASGHKIVLSRGVGKALQAGLDQLQVILVAGGALGRVLPFWPWPWQYPGFGPVGDLSFTTYMYLPSPLKLTELGYQPVGINPSTRLLP